MTNIKILNPQEYPKSNNFKFMKMTQTNIKVMKMN